MCTCVEYSDLHMCMSQMNVREFICLATEILRLKWQPHINAGTIYPGGRRGRTSLWRSGQDLFSYHNVGLTAYSEAAPSPQHRQQTQWLLHWHQKASKPPNTNSLNNKSIAEAHHMLLKIIVKKYHYNWHITDKYK